MRSRPFATFCMKTSTSALMKQRPAAGDMYMRDGDGGGGGGGSSDIKRRIDE